MDVNGLSMSSQLDQRKQQLSWLFGRWKGKGCGIYSTIKPFEYLEEVEFCDNGFPFICYKASSWDTENKKPMHWESGFLRLKPESETVAFLLAHNFGVSEVLEGELTGDKELHLKSTQENISRMSFAKPPRVIETKRVFKCLDQDKMEYKFFMATEDQPLQLHLHITFERVKA